MSEQELNSYRFVSGEEPGDERLKKIMQEVTRDVMSRRHAADALADQKAQQMRCSLREKWANRINNATHG